MTLWRRDGWGYAGEASRGPGVVGGVLRSLASWLTPESYRVTELPMVLGRHSLASSLVSSRHEAYPAGPVGGRQDYTGPV